LDDLGTGRIDAALLALVAGMDAFEHELIAKDDFVLAGPAGHPLVASASPASQRDLKGAQVLLLEDGHCLRDQALAVCGTAGAKEADFRATSLGTLAQVVAGGAGVTLLPALSLKVETRRAELEVRRFKKPAPSRRIVLARRRQSPLAGALLRVALAIRKGLS
jgi:LysR family hydrogen peroxide-inducible transcriptional activator